ncbi:MAG: sigma-70 family RNA polymerase sigma factor [Bacteroidales bacterium]|nr:sigma-70 family RNA polymerase sigma factor [Bacteroidales bacterium]
MDQFSDIEIIEGIRNHNNVILTFVYKQYYPLIRSYITLNRGSDEDAKDIFQEAIIVIFKNSKQSDFSINSSFKTYLYSVCKIIWLKQLRSRNIHLRNLVELTEFVEFSSKDQKSFEDSLEFRIFRKHFDKLGKDCQKVLQMAMNKIPMEEIALEMGYKSEKFARNRAYRCKKMLHKMITEDPEFRNLQKD